ncbi:hypothetical protein SVAN01_05362 [Stagonosporopsis vannaccii]|nr:hypothetical protein SVAN01_05362 [Stagonosporopsis vannaccii]
MPLFAAMLRRGDHEDGTIAIFLSAPLTSPRFLTRCQPMTTSGCPRCRQSNPCMCHDERATHARLPASARFGFETRHHHRSCITCRLGCRCPNCARCDIPQICVQGVGAQLRFLAPSRLRSMTRTTSKDSRLRSGPLRVAILGLELHTSCSSKESLGHAAKHRTCLPHSRIVGVLENCRLSMPIHRLQSQ